MSERQGEYEIVSETGTDRDTFDLYTACTWINGRSQKDRKGMKESDTGTDRDTFDLYTWINGSLTVSNLVIGLFNFRWMEMAKLLT